MPRPKASEDQTQIAVRLPTALVDSVDAFALPLGVSRNAAIIALLGEGARTNKMQVARAYDPEARTVERVARMPADHIDRVRNAFRPTRGDV